MPRLFKDFLKIISTVWLCSLRLQGKNPSGTLGPKQGHQDGVLDNDLLTPALGRELRRVGNLTISLFYEGSSCITIYNNIPVKQLYKIIGLTLPCRSVEVEQDDLMPQVSVAGDGTAAAGFRIAGMTTGATTLSLGFDVGGVLPGNGSAAVVGSDRPTATVVPTKLVLLNILRREIAFLGARLDTISVSMWNRRADVNSSLSVGSSRLTHFDEGVSSRT